MATTKKLLAAVGTVLAVYLVISLFFFLLSLDSPYSDGDMFLVGIVNSPWWAKIVGSALIIFAILYGIVNKKSLTEKAKKISWDFFSGK